MTEGASWLDELRSTPTIRPRRWAELAGAAPSSVYDQITRGDLPAVRLGGAWHILTVPLLELLGVPTAPESDRMPEGSHPRLVAVPDPTTEEGS